MYALFHRMSSLFIPFNCQSSAIHYTKHESRRPPHLPLEIWMEIFQFATYVHRSATLKPLDPFLRKRASTNAMALNTPVLAMRTKCSLVLVSRLWRSISIRILYEHLVINSPARANMILRILEESYSNHSKHETASQLDGLTRATLGYGQWIRHLEIYTHARGSSKIQHLKALFRIFQLCPNVRILSGSWYHVLPPEFLDSISTIYGLSLEGLYWNEPRRGPWLSERDSLTSPQFLGSFKALRVLDLRHFLGCDSAKEKSDIPLSNSPTLPCVQDLIISAHPQSLEAAITLSLPALQNLTLKTSSTDAVSTELLSRFLKVHGHSLVNVDIPTLSPNFEPESDSIQSQSTMSYVNPSIFLETGVCPNLLSITFPVTSPEISPHVHTSLRRIGLRGVRGDGLYPEKQSLCKDHLMAITPTRYPNLELVQTVGFLVEADSDGLMKDIFIWWVERFDKYSIDFLDGEGVLWTYADEDPGDVTSSSNSVSQLAAVGSRDLNDKSRADANGATS